MKRVYEGNEWGDAKRQRGTGPHVDIRILLPSKVKFHILLYCCCYFLVCSSVLTELLMLQILQFSVYL